MYEQALTDAGLTNGEAKVYLALLKIGESTVGPLAKEANVSLSKIYEILQNLIKKGLASSIKKNNKKFFHPADPERIVEYLENKKQSISESQKAINKVIPKLKLQKERINNESEAMLFEGFKGIKTFYESLLKDIKPKETILVVGIPEYTARKYEGYFLDWNKRRSKRGIPIKLIFNEDARDLGKSREKIKFTEVRYLPGNATPAWILVYARGVATIHLAENPICVLIKDKKAIESYTEFFHSLWKIAKK